MRCERCGKELTNRIIKINGVTYCDNCARLMGYDRYLRDPADLMGNPFAPLDQIASSLLQMNELDFGNSALSCPKCGMTLRDFEKRGRLGCIECYNTFNDYIVKEMFKQQGESTYGGRLPGQSAEMKNIKTDALPEAKKEETSEAKAEPETKESSEVKEPANAAESESVNSAEMLEKLAKADLGMLSDEELKNGIKLAAENEDYVLASKLRDELKGRNGGN